MERLKTILREPLLQFLLIGLGLFLLHARITPRGERLRIVVDRARVDGLSSQYEATWGRPPTSDELAALVDGWVREEIAFREGVELGLDRDDPVIRRRVRQKLEVMAEEGDAAAMPTDAALDAWLHAHPADFRRPPAVDFDQLLLANGAPSPAEIAARAAAARAALERGVAPSTLGERTLLPRDGVGVGLDLVARDFGGPFADRLVTAPLGTWEGPVASALGVHLFRVRRRSDAALPLLEEVRVAVARAWESDRRRRALEANDRRLREKYAISIEAEVLQAPPAVVGAAAP